MRFLITRHLTCLYDSNTTFSSITIIFAFPVCLLRHENDVLFKCSFSSGALKTSFEEAKNKVPQSQKVI